MREPDKGLGTHCGLSQLLPKTVSAKLKTTTTKKSNQQNSNMGLWSSTGAGSSSLSLDISYIHSFSGSTGRQVVPKKFPSLPVPGGRHVQQSLKQTAQLLRERWMAKWQGWWCPAWQVTTFSWQHFCSVTAKYQEIWHMPGKGSFQLYPFNGFLGKNYCPGLLSLKWCL